MNPITDEIKNAVYDILVNYCGAWDDEWKRTSFRHSWPDCREWRFQGALGYGGKVWSQASRWTNPHPYVTCYKEDETPVRLEMIRRANEKLTELLG